MANIRKSFSFRNGVQVDDDDLVVRSNLVGIGTTVPTETLDVRGTTKLVGFTTMVGDFQVSGVSTFANKVAIGTQVSINSGVITANSFYGDGSTLSNLPTSQWVDVDVGLGFTSIYASGNVGIGTTDPQRLMQVGGNPDYNQTGTVFDRQGNIYSTGIITGRSFIGFGSGITEINASNISTGSLNLDRLPVLTNSKIPNNFQVSGIITALGGFIGTVTGNLIGNVTGNVIGIATTARGLTGTPDIIVGVVTATTVTSGSLISSGIVSTSTLAVGANGSVFNVNSSGRIGIGSANPTSDLQLVRTGDAKVEIISSSGESSIAIGNTVGTGNSTALLRFGNEVGAFDIVNRSTGSINNYLHAGASGINTGTFSWIYGQTNAKLMNLTYDGRLGLGITNPANTLHVVGTSTVTSNSFIGGDLRVKGTVIVGPSGVVVGGLGVLPNNIFVNTGVSTFAQVTINSAEGESRIGIGTSAPITGLDARQSTALFNSVGITTTILGDGISFKVDGTSIFDRVGLGTTAFYDPPGEDSGGILQVHDNSINIYSGILYLENSSIGLGTNAPRAVADFGNVGAGLTEIGYLLLPSVDQGLVVGMTTLPTIYEGGMLFNTTSKKFQGYDGTSVKNFAFENTVGKVIQVVKGVTSTAVYHNSESSTGLSTSITLSSSSNKVMVYVTQPLYITGSAQLTLKRSGSGITTAYHGSWNNNSILENNSNATSSISYLDSPGSASTFTYETFVTPISAASDCTSNVYSSLDAGGSYHSTATSTITLMEILA